jgi:hypothetical protein
MNQNVKVDLLTENKSVEIGGRLLLLRRKTHRRLAQETGVYKARTRTATKVLALQNHSSALFAAT